MVMQTLIDILWRTWAVLAEMAPYLLLGFAIAGVLRVVLPTQWIRDHLGGRGVGSVVKSALLGVPLPLCSCGVMPVAAGIRQQGASRGATASFLIATPQTGVDSIAATWALLGWPMAVARAVVALGIGIASGIGADVASRGAVSLPVSNGGEAKPQAAGGCCGGESEPAAKSSCCSGEVKREVKSSCCSSTQPEAKGSDCCGEADAATTETRPSRAAAWLSGMRFAFVTLPKDIAIALLLGALLAGVLTAVLTPEVVAPYLGGWWAVPVMALVGLPVYICSTGVIPLALAMHLLGATDGAVLTLMIAGPAANAATWSIAHKTLGFRAALATLATAALGAVVAGYVVDFTGVGPWLLNAAEPEHLHAPHVAWYGHATAILLILMLSQRWWPTVRRLAPGHGRSPQPAPNAN